MPARLLRLLYDAYCQIQSPSPYSPHTTSPSIHPLLSTRALTVVSREPSRLTLSPTTAVTSRSSFSNASMSVETGTRRRLWRLLQMWTGAQTKGTGCSTNPEGTRWDSSCWYTYNLRRYESPLQFDIPVAYPQVAPEIELPTLDDKTHKMYCGGKMCLTVHFKLLWAKNCLRFGLANALCLGLAPWLAAEVPILDDEAAPVNATAASGSAAAS